MNLDLLTPRSEVQDEPAVAATQPSSGNVRRRRARWPRVVANVILIVATCATGLAVLGSVAGWWRIETVLSASMEPSIHPGDLEILRPEATDDIKVGQVLAFHPPKEQITVTHRVLDVQHESDGVWITTKGDANNAADPWGRIRVSGSQVWVVRHVVPHAGALNTFVKGPAIRLVLLSALVLLGIGVALDAIWRS